MPSGVVSVCLYPHCTSFPSSLLSLSSISSPTLSRPAPLPPLSSTHRVVGYGPATDFRHEAAVRRVQYNHRLADPLHPGSYQPHTRPRALPPMYTSSSNAHRPLQHSRPAAHRARSSSDPFSDPVYTAPTVAYSRSDAPPPPPKQQQSYKKSSRPHTDPRDPRMLETAVRDAVTVRQTDSPSRTRMGRSQTGFVPSSRLSISPCSQSSASGVQTNVAGSRHAPAARRSYSQDSVTQAMEKSRKSGGKNKKSSTHADVIDKLDFTGVGPSTCFSFISHSLNDC